jgi:alkylated DNA repair dioxygenase AlkB
MLNLYRSGEDSISWHADDEPELGPTSAVVIASISLGVTRRFQLRRREEGSKILSIDLSSGSLLFLGPGSQSDWLHRVPKSPSSSPNPAPLFTNPTHQRRVNITFRKVSP